MRGIFEVHIVGKGEYGPFPADENGPARSYKYVVLTSADGEGDPVKATYAPGLELEPELFKPTKVVLELREKGKLRFHGLAPARAGADVRAA